MNLAIGIDIGGTNSKGVIINKQGEILEKCIVPTADDSTENWKKTAAKLVFELKESSDKHIDLIGISCPGFADEKNSHIAFMPGRLAGLEKFDWEYYLKTPTYVLNDAHAALIAESSYGAIKGYRNAVLLTLGTGVGGGLLIDGELYQGLGQMAGHFGHTTLNSSDDELSLLGIPGSLEYAIGNHSVSRRSNGRFKSTHEMVNGYRIGEPFATWLWLDAVRKLGVAIASITNSISPEIIVLAGGITKADDALFTPLNEFLDVYEFRRHQDRTPVKSARFSDWAGAVGAASFAFLKSCEKQNVIIKSTDIV